MNKSNSLTYLFRIFLCFSCLFTAVHDANARDVNVDNTVTYVGAGTYRWTVFLVGPRDQLDRIKYVDYCLQNRPSYPNPRRRVANRKTRFALSEFGYEEFDIRVNVFFNDGTFRTIDYRLKLIDRSVPQSKTAYTSPRSNMPEWIDCGFRIADCRFAIDLWPSAEAQISN